MVCLPYVKSRPIDLSPLAADILTAFPNEIANSAKKAAGAGNMSYMLHALVADKSTTAVDEPAGTVEFTASQWIFGVSMIRPRRTFTTRGTANWNGFFTELNRCFTLETRNPGGNVGYADGHAAYRKHNSIRYRGYGATGAPDRSKTTWGSCVASVVSAERAVRLDDLDGDCAFAPRF